MQKVYKISGEYSHSELMNFTELERSIFITIQQNGGESNCVKIIIHENNEIKGKYQALIIMEIK